jgi:hypothetical protein
LGGEVVRSTPLAREAAESAQFPDYRSPETPDFRITPELRIVLNSPTPLRVWSVSAFADQVALTPVATYELTESSLHRALGAGFQLEDVTRFLERQSGQALPSETRERLESWESSFARVWMTPMVALQPEQPANRGAIRDLLVGAGYVVSDHDGELHVALPSPARPDELERAVVSLLEGSGHNPQTKSLRAELQDREEIREPQPEEDSS